MTWALEARSQRVAAGPWTWLASAVAAAIVGYFAARFPTHDVGPVAAVVTIIVVALPSFVAAARWLGIRRAAALLGSLSLFAYVVEALALVTGWPYGSFAYGTGIGPKIADFLPLTLPLAYVPLVLGAVALAERYAPRSSRRWWAIGVLGLVAFDLVLDPGAVALSYWSYAGGGLYYGVPLSNYLGWLATSTVALAIVRYGLRRAPSVEAAPGPALGFSVFLSMAMWSGVAAYGGQVLPMTLGAGLLLLLLPSRASVGLERAETPAIDNISTNT